MKKSGEIFVQKLEGHRSNMRALVYVGSPEDIIPYAWRYPLSLEALGEKRTNKVYRTITKSEAERAALALT